MRAVARSTPLWAIVCVTGWLGAGRVEGQQVDLTLVPDVAVWNEQIEARVTGVGCSGVFAQPVEKVVSNQHVIDIDLLGCDAASTASFSATVRVGPFHPLFSPYRIRLRKGPEAPGPTPPPLPVLDQVELPVYEAGSADFVLPVVATDAAPVLLTTIVRRTAASFTVEEPRVLGKIIELTYRMDPPPPILPIPVQPALEPIDWNLGSLAEGVYEVRLFERNLDNWPDKALVREQLVVHAARCVPSPTRLCLGGGRFQVEATWSDFSGGTGAGHARPLDGDGASGLLWFFSPENVEVTVKVLDGCGVNGSYWVFLSSGSTVAFEVRVTDRVTGATRHYANASGQSAPLVSDTSAFSCGGS
ncbi:MAG: hypothetical protein IPJ17_10465 [Holophagales bacterium]|nr:MAG: hypothetical protein IPJ17_10465 [Holophagales bacterium]